jgi:hypothetical protein
MATTTQVVREAPEIEAYKLGLLKSAKALQAPEQPAYQVAGMGQDQLDALATGRGGIGDFQPFLEAGNTALNTSQGVLGDAANLLVGADTRDQFTAANQAVNTGLQQTMDVGQPIGQQQIQQYMNPYSDLVLNQQLQEMNRQAQIQGQSLDAQAVRAGAFGGSREGIQQAELGRNLAQTQNQAIAQAMQGNYGQALNTAQQQQQVGLASANQIANMGQGIGQLATGEYNIGAGMASGLGSLGAQLGNVGVQQAALGAQQQTLGQNDVNFLYNLGSAEQRQQQSELDALRATQLQETMQPYNQLAFLSDIYKGAPSTQMSASQIQQPAPSPFQQVAGLVTGTVGTAAAAKSAGIL